MDEVEFYRKKISACAKKIDIWKLDAANRKNTGIAFVIFKTHVGNTFFLFFLII